MTTEFFTKKCTCGKTVVFWSALTGQGYCSDDCYDKARDEHADRDGNKCDQREA